MSSEETVVGNSSADTAATVTMSLLTAVAIVGNLAVLVAIVRSPSLRVQLTNFFVINLCVVDLVAGTIVMPMSLDRFTTRYTSTNITLSGLINEGRSIRCTAFRLLSTFVVFASVLSIALANVERYVSIRHPMQHAAHLTVRRTLMAIVSVWAAALGVATTPVVADWHVLDTGTRCCVGVASATPTAATVFVIVVLVLLFVAPTSVMAAMCCSIYRVARQAGRQVVPGVDDGSVRPPERRLPRRSSSTVSAARCSVVQSSTSCPTMNNIQRHTGVAKSLTVIGERSLDIHEDPATSHLPTARDTPECVIRITRHKDDASTRDVTDHRDRCTMSQTPTRVVEAQLSAGAVADRRWKAAATLLFILLTFVPLWSPYFAYGLYRAVERNQQVSDCGSVTSAHHIETAVVWIGFTTFASNAFVYGWMNRAIRDALRETVDVRLGSCARGRARLSQVLGAGDAEDFFQFLERTSNIDRAQSLTQSSTTSVEPSINRTRP